MRTIFARRQRGVVIKSDAETNSLTVTHNFWFKKRIVLDTKSEGIREFIVRREDTLTVTYDVKS